MYQILDLDLLPFFCPKRREHKKLVGELWEEEFPEWAPYSGEYLFGEECFHKPV